MDGCHCQKERKMQYQYFKDPDSQETQEWLDAFDSVIKSVGKKRATFLLKAIYDKAVQEGLRVKDRKSVV